MAVLEALGRQYGSGTAVSRALGRHVGNGMAVSAALGRQVGPGTAVSGALGRVERPQGRPGVQKRTPNSTRIDAARTKIDAKWVLEAQKNELCQAAPSGISLGMFFIDFWCFREVSEASEVPRLSAKTRVGHFALWVALEPQKTLKM